MRQLQNSDKIVNSLMELKDELVIQSNHNETAKIILLKINSCLFKEYPVSDQRELPL